MVLLQNPCLLCHRELGLHRFQLQRIEYFYGLLCMIPNFELDACLINERINPFHHVQVHGCQACLVKDIHRTSPKRPCHSLLGTGWQKGLASKLMTLTLHTTPSCYVLCDTLEHSRSRYPSRGSIAATRYSQQAWNAKVL